MADAPLSTLSRAREQKISELSQHFANDDLSLDELERRIEQVYKAASVSELDAITSDLRVSQLPATARPSSAAMSNAPVDYGTSNLPAPRSRLLAVMSESKRTGRWLVPQRLDVVALMADTKIDLTSAVMPAGGAEFHVRSFWAACKIIVPPEMRVINEMHAIMASVTSKAHEMDAPGSQRAGPVIRLTGTAVMAEVKVVVRTVESVHDDDDDDDE
jgi:hypothetical protein